MAQKIVLLDDLEDGEVPADEGTVAFSLEGSHYELDLSKKNATKLRNVLAPFIASARHAGKRAPAKATRTKSGGSGLPPEQLQAMREWGRKNGWPNLSDKGRVPAEVQLAFEQAQQAPKAAAV